MANILVIDDEELVRLAVRRSFEACGHTITAVENGAQGTRMVQDNAPDTAITDLFLPEREGVPTIVKIRSTHGQLPIIAMSGGGRVGSKNFLQMAAALAC